MRADCPLSAKIPKQDTVHLQSYVRGFLDEVLHRPYNDGVNPEHRMLVFIPPTEDEFNNNPAAAYRAGRIAGMFSRN